MQPVVLIIVLQHEQNNSTKITCASMIIATPNRTSNATHDLPTPHQSRHHHTNTNTNAEHACFSCDLQCGCCGWGRACDKPISTVARMRDCMLLMHRHKHSPILVHLGLHFHRTRLCRDHGYVQVWMQTRQPSYRMYMSHQSGEHISMGNCRTRSWFA